MIQREINIQYKEYTNDELSEKQSFLLSQSVKAQESSHSPYSQFRVGAAILLENDQVCTLYAILWEDMDALESRIFSAFYFFSLTYLKL